MWRLFFVLWCSLTSCQRSPIWVAEDPSVRALHEKNAGNAGMLVKTAWIDAPATDRARARFVFTNTSERSLFLEYMRGTDVRSQWQVAGNSTWIDDSGSVVEDGRDILIADNGQLELKELKPGAAIDFVEVVHKSRCKDGRLIRLGLTVTESDDANGPYRFVYSQGFTWDVR
jgi:hypothetical protein